MYKIYQKILKKLCWLGKGQVLHHERNKVEVLEGKFRSLKLFFVPRKKTAFHVTWLTKTTILHVFACCTCSEWINKNIYPHEKRKIPFRLVRLVQRFCKVYHIILFEVAMLVLLNQWEQKLQITGFAVVLNRGWSLSVKQAADLFCWFRREASRYREEMKTYLSYL